MKAELSVNLHQPDASVKTLVRPTVQLHDYHVSYAVGFVKKLHGLLAGQYLLVFKDDDGKWYYRAFGTEDEGGPGRARKNFKRLLSKRKEDGEYYGGASITRRVE